MSQENVDVVKQFETLMVPSLEETDHEAAQRRQEHILSILDPEVVLRVDVGKVPTAASRLVRGAPAVARQAMLFSKLADSVRPALVNGAAGIVSFDKAGEPFNVVGFTVVGGQIVEINVLSDPQWPRRLDRARLDE